MLALGDAVNAQTRNGCMFEGRVYSERCMVCISRGPAVGGHWHVCKEGPRQGNKKTFSWENFNSLYCQPGKDRPKC